MNTVDIDLTNIRAFEAPDGPITMLNLYKFRSTSDMKHFTDSLIELVGPILQRLGAEVIYNGFVGNEFVSGDDWDVIALVKYPSYQAFLELFADPQIAKEIESLRRTTMLQSRLMVTFGKALEI